METPTLHNVAANGLDLAVWEWPGSDTPLVFAHATGFHGRCWDRIAREFPGRRRLAVDFRGHGRSSKPDPPYHWKPFGSDLAAVAQALNVRDAIGVGHSMGGHSIVAAALQRPETFRSLLLVDPTIFRRQYYGQAPTDAAFVLRRRNSWTSSDEMFERFHNRPPFSLWQADVLRDYCDYGLLPNGEQFMLACPPAIEASIYGHSTAAESDLYDGIPSIPYPVVVLRAGVEWTIATFNPSASPTAPDLATKFPQGRDVFLADRDHFIPMQAPELVVEQIRLLLE
jgi:pimeloyl-ACP methyl ester carboxylesterase